jgi:hypothetical protein
MARFAFLIDCHGNQHALDLGGLARDVGVEFPQVLGGAVLRNLLGVELKGGKSGFGVEVFAQAFR